METSALWLSLILFLIVTIGALRSVFERQWIFLRTFNEAKEAYVVLAVAATGLFIWAHFGSKLHITSIEVAGVKAELGNLQQKVATLSDQMELFFQRKKIEVFDKSNWNRVRVVEKARWHLVLEVTLQEEPIPNSVEVFEGPLPMPEQDYQLNGRILRFPANTDEPSSGLTIKYYPRAIPNRSTAP
jgi:hypothetical protein